MAMPSPKVMGQKPVPDTGYTKVCPFCSRRYGIRPALIGRERFVDIEACGSCTPFDLNKARSGRG